jgi:signal transduction histidine kinase
VAAPVPSPEWLETANRLSTVARQIVSVAHETNNLLQVITGSAEMLETGRDTPEQTLRRARIIGDHARRASELLSAVLDLARDASTAIEPTDIGRLTQHALDLRKYSLNRAKIATGFEPESGSAVALANRRWTLQILLNLLMNAEHALIGRTDARLVVRVQRDRSAVVVTVEDNGPGLGRGPSADAVNDSGPPLLGVGLEVASRLAHAQSGTLVIAAGERGGTVATLRLAMP